MATVRRGPPVLAIVIEGAADARIRRDRPQDRQGHLCARRAAAARGPAQRAVRSRPIRAGAGAADHFRRGSRRPRRDREPADGVDGPAPHPGPGVRAAHAGGNGAPGGLALLARVAGEGQGRHLHERVVPRNARGPVARRNRRRRAARADGGDTAPRTDADGRRHRPAQVLDPPVEGRPEEAAATARRECPHPLARDARGLEPLAPLRQVARPVGTHAAGNIHRRGAVVRRRGHRRALSQPVRRQDPAGRHAADPRREEASGAATRADADDTGDHRQRQADSRPRPDEEALAAGI